MNKLKQYAWLLLLTFACLSCSSMERQKNTPSKLKALIIDGSNNHYVWPKTSFMMKSYLEQTGLFEVEISRYDSVWLGVKYNPNRPEAYESFIKEYPVNLSLQNISTNPLHTSDFSVDFSQYDVIISNLGAQTPEWPKETREKFEQYMLNGGGLIVVHAANNAWGDWKAFNKMIGLGAWGGRDSTTGPYAFYDDAGNLHTDHVEGICGSHGMEQEFVVTARAPEHPIMKGLPTEWLHAKDEMYDRMRGPFENATVLATAYSDVEKNKQPWEPTLSGSGKHVPMLMAINYGKGRVFHSTLGHFDYSMECIGFITTLQRGAEWAATGDVTQKIPADFPTKDKSSSRSFSVNAL
ncbi:ThuA domain-containing protein [Limibacter armeniacum]|uniref:ThuA domain-containing protein n=1 Tax=Limibacter armeniacum TaxID=466084 RepID=UPI002FE66AB5